MKGVGKRDLRRGVIILPSAFTLGNLFFGVWAIVSASRGDFYQAAWFILLAGVADMFDGRVARFTSTGSDFGEQLDSLVDAVSFGVAPALIMYFLFLGDAGWNWVVPFIYIAATIVRLARFNVEQGGHAKNAFHGLPSPAAGMTLATFYPFTQTALFQDHLSHLPWHQIAAGMMILLSGLMVSHVLYPVVPKFSARSVWGIATMIAALIGVVALLTRPSVFFFPALSVYVVFGLGRTAVLGFLDRLPERDPLIDEDEEDVIRELEYDEMMVRRPPENAPKEDIR
jgi:CDP-diacylglycerol---serine O-phosphatidyltransferase